MPKQSAIELEGVITETLPNANTSWGQGEGGNVTL